MFKFNRLLLILPLLALAAGATAWFLNRAGDLEKTVNSLGLKGKFAGFAITRQSVHEVKGHRVTELMAGKDVSEVRLTVIEQGGSASSNYIEQRLFQINSQFNSGVSPYPGAVSKKNACPPDFEPVVEKIDESGWTGRLILTFANQRKLLGVCEESERHFDVAILILMCKGRGTIFDITAFTPLSAAGSRSLLRDVVCL